MKFFDEFKTFIMRGNVVDMAVGVVVGGAFKSIVDSLVKDIITPCIGALTGKVDISKLSLTVIEANEASGETGLVIPYGNFLQQIINFLIIAFSIFCAVKLINALHKKFLKTPEKKETAPPSPTQEQLLSEIRDLLKEQNKQN
ncbi:MAG: large-conductance mechanosensitive channel protein MscL [Hominilimicola sp.]